MSVPGSSPKGAARREEILDRVVEVIDQDGYNNFSVRAIARAAGLSQAGLLHYFATKEELLLAVIRHRAAGHRAHRAPGPEVDVFLETIAGIHNAGIQRLLLSVSVDSTDDRHPGYTQIGAKYPAMRTRLADDIRSRQAAGTFPADRDADMSASMLIAYADGVQIQWLFDPSIDMGAGIRELWAMLCTPTGA